MPQGIPAVVGTVFFALLVFVSLPVAAQSQVFTFEQGVSGYTGFDDTSIFSESENAGGGTEGIFSGTIQNLDFFGNEQHRRALLRADISIIPSGWIVESVSLTLTVQRSGGNFGDVDYTLHRITGSWGEGTVVGMSMGGFGDPAENGDATWLSRHHNATPWIAEGGDFVAAPSATAPAGFAETVAIWTSSGMIDDAQLWVNAPASNEGWMIVSAIEGTRQRVKEFYSSEASMSRPILQIVARPPAASLPVSVPRSLFVQVLMLVLLAHIVFLRSCNARKSGKV